MLAKANMKRVISGSALALAGLAFQSHVEASIVTLLNWAPVPDAGVPDVINYAGSLATGPGAVGNGDGNLPPTQQTPGGLQVDTPFNAPIPFSFPDSMFTGGTGYYDATLLFNGLAAVGAAQQLNIGPFTQDSQLLGPGSFTVISTAPAGSVVLLSGTIQGATVVTGIQGGNAAASFNADGVTYTGGAILAAASPNVYRYSGNDMSISMTDVTPNISINPTTGQLGNFTADATGLFDINTVPEPATLSVALLGAGALAMRRRRKA